MKHVVMFSGGIGSWAAAKRVAKDHGTTDLVLLFGDTLIEDDDLYRFLREAADDVGGQLVWIAEGRTPWEVFRDERFIGNSMADPCSKILKRNFLRRWLAEHCDPTETTVYLGIDWSEIHRLERAADRWAPWTVQAPLCKPPLTSKEELLRSASKVGLRPPRLYELGFPHNNCGGFCVKAGQGHFKRLLEVLPERYRMHEEKEEELRAYLGRDVSILKDRRGGRTSPMSMREFRKRVQDEPSTVDEFEWGGCGCAVD